MKENITNGKRGRKALTVASLLAVAMLITIGISTSCGPVKVEGGMDYQIYRNQSFVVDSGYLYTVGFNESTSGDSITVVASMKQTVSGSLDDYDLPYQMMVLFTVPNIDGKHVYTNMEAINAIYLCNIYQKIAQTYKEKLSEGEIIISIENNTIDISMDIQTKHKLNTNFLNSNRGIHISDTKENLSMNTKTE